MLLILLILIVSLIYIISMQGITCCNSGSLYALTRALAEKRRCSIDEYMKYTEYNGEPLDYSKRDKHYYTDRPPGLSFAAVPFYLLKINVVLLSVISGVLATVMVYLISRHLVGNELIAFSTALIFAFATLNWKYSITFLIHPLSAFLILLAVYLYLIGSPILFIGVIFGLATMVEYTDALSFFAIFIYQIILGEFASLPFLAIGYVLGVTPLLIYNARCFGSPFTTSYRYSGHFKWSNSFKTTFVTPIWKGALGLLFFVPKKRGLRLPGGILTASPVLIFGMIGFYYLSPHIRILFLLLTVPLFLMIAKHITWWAGGAGDYRYLSSIIPFLAIPISLTWKNLGFLSPVIIIFAAISILMVAIRIITITASEEDLKKITPTLTPKIKEKKQGRLALANPKYLYRAFGLAIECLFIRKVHLEKNIKIPEELNCKTS